MPIYEFYCADCHRVFNFLSRAVDTTKRPACPRCGRPELPRRPSLFAISRGLKEAAKSEGSGDADESRLEKAMESLAGEMAGLNEEDPRQSVRLMRKLYQAAGMPMGAGMEEALRRMESGEDPEKVEQEMGDVEENPFGMEGAGTPPEAQGGLKGLRRRFLAPSMDSTLYEL